MKIKSFLVAVAFAAASFAAPTSADDSYPLTTCVVSGKKLDSMGGPVKIVHEGTTVKLCCGSCKKKFNKTPKKYIAKIKKAEKSN